MKIEAQPTLWRLPLYARKSGLIRKIQTSEGNSRAPRIPQLLGQYSSSWGCVRQRLHFPTGLRVLVVDDYLNWLEIVEQMLTRCNYSAMNGLIQMSSYSILVSGGCQESSLARKNHFHLVLPFNYCCIIRFRELSSS
nr:PREDICTED: uncharacterized protein LOC108193945 isoform X1 [Daucus carota subsp. sativus]